ncbi:TIR-only protein-like [Telopea speciosissima]|uniref:TIR-only protein-like n=1 Tax=Telopea speciosissima TaxID=54955 RepID=UPI001CC7462F|nr:TIR-only protein-like [Telopea speciosissima]
MACTQVPVEVARAIGESMRGRKRTKAEKDKQKAAFEEAVCATRPGGIQGIMIVIMTVMTQHMCLMMWKQRRRLEILGGDRRGVWPAYVISKRDTEEELVRLRKFQKVMQRSLAKQLVSRIQPVVRRPCDVFINHRSIDTKRTVAGLLYDHFIRLNLHPFLDSKNMKPGDKLFQHIDSSIRDCKIGVAVFSPTYCRSYFCLHELALLMECKKKVIPIFCDVKPSELLGLDDGICQAKDLNRFKWAIEEAKYTVGLTFDSSNGNWSDFLRSASDIVVKSLIELEAEGCNRHYPLPTSTTTYLF